MQHMLSRSLPYGAVAFDPTSATSCFQVLPSTLGLGPEIWRVLDKAHKLRNQSEYEGDLALDETFVRDLVIACTAVEGALAALGPLAGR
jgi:hypothetical protein